MTDLSGRAALVTGSTRGIGRAIAAALIERGVNVAVSGRAETRAREVAEELTRRGPGRAVGIACDVRDPERCARLVAETVQAFGRLDALVNNAGVGHLKPVHELSLEEWHDQIETNLGGVFYCSRAAVPHLRATADGWIVNIASLAGKNAFAGGAGYNATKFGLVGMSEAMMLDLRYEGVRVSVIMPGSVQTEFGGRFSADKEWALQPEDVAAAVVQLLELPPRALVSRVEMRPTRPGK